MTVPALNTYAALRKKIEETLVLGQQKVEETKVLTYWQTGRLINQYLQKSSTPYQERGKKVVANLAQDLGYGEKVFYRCMRFAEAFPNFASGRNLSWSHYRVLFALEDPQKRLEYAALADKKHWTAEDLQLKVRNLLWDERVEKADGKAPSLLDLPALGAFWTYQVTDPGTADGKLLLDLGFSCSRHLDAVTSSKFKPGAVVTSVKDPRGNYKLSAISSELDSLYTYKAQVERVIDGDTLKAVIDIGFDTTTRQTLRFRGIDCPEMDTPEGKAAKRFVENALADCSFITVRSVQSRKEKWGRYLADVFLPARDIKIPAGGTSPDRGQVLDDKSGQQVYLNNLLLEKGHAVKVRF